MATKMVSITISTATAGHSLKEKSRNRIRNEVITNARNRTKIVRKSIAFMPKGALGSTPVKFLKNILLTFLTTLRNEHSSRAFGYLE